MEILKCPSCGAHINHDSKECQYCGSVFLSNKKLETQTENIPFEPAKTIEIKPITIKTTEEADSPSLLSIVIAFIIFWPLGLILLFQRLSKKI